MPIIHPYTDPILVQAVFLAGVIILSIVAGLKSGQSARQREHHEQR
jgi:hypothetical protein